MIHTVFVLLLSSDDVRLDTEALSGRESHKSVEEASFQEVGMVTCVDLLMITLDWKRMILEEAEELHSLMTVMQRRLILPMFHDLLKLIQVVLTRMMIHHRMMNILDVSKREVEDAKEVLNRIQKDFFDQESQSLEQEGHRVSHSKKKPHLCWTIDLLEENILVVNAVSAMEGANDPSDVEVNAEDQIHTTKQVHGEDREESD
jgi:hypothetical protein